MVDWKSLLKWDATEWLLEKDNPSVRYFTLTDLIGESSTDEDVKEAKEEIMKIGVVPSILAEQERALRETNPLFFQRTS